MLEFVHKAIVASYSGHSGAEEAVQKLQQSGLPMNHLSIIGRDWQVNEDVEGFYHSGDTVKAGEFLIVVHGTAEETSYDHEILQATSTTSIATHDKAS